MDKELEFLQTKKKVLIAEADAIKAQIDAGLENLSQAIYNRDIEMKDFDVSKFADIYELKWLAGKYYWLQDTIKDVQRYISDYERYRDYMGRDYPIS